MELVDLEVPRADPGDLTLFEFGCIDDGGLALVQCVVVGRVNFPTEDLDDGRCVAVVVNRAEVLRWPDLEDIRDAWRVALVTLKVSAVSRGKTA